MCVCHNIARRVCQTKYVKQISRENGEQKNIIQDEYNNLHTPE